MNRRMLRLAPDEPEASHGDVSSGQPRAAAAVRFDGAGRPTGRGVCADLNSPMKTGTSFTRSSSSFSQPRHRMDIRIVPSRAGRPASYASCNAICWSGRTTTATACSRASAISRSILSSVCCSFAWAKRPKRLRVNGRAEVVLDDPLMKEFVGAQALVRVTPIDIFPNCPRYIPDLAAGKPSPYVPRADQAPVEPG